jgi:integrase
VAVDALLALRPQSEPHARLFRLNVPAVEYRWKLARKAAGVTGLRWHDLRHEGLSRMAEKGLTLGELKAQSGHRTAQVLLGYVNAKAAEVARKLG